MRCPYILDKIVTQRPGKTLFSRTTVTQQVTHECLKGGCAAWLDGYCAKTLLGGGVEVDMEEPES